MDALGLIPFWGVIRSTLQLFSHLILAECLRVAGADAEIGRRRFPDRFRMTAARWTLTR